jgi:acyl carrier protein
MDASAVEPPDAADRSHWMAGRGPEIHREVLDFLIRRLSQPTGIPAVDAVTGVNPSRILPEAALEGDLGVDSLGMVELLMALEDSFGFALSEEEGGGIVTVGDLVALVVRRKLAGETGHGEAG